MGKFKDFQKAVVAQDDMKQYGTACLKFLLSLSNRSKSTVPQAVLTRQISPKHGLPGNINAIHNLAVLDFILELDFPQYSGTRLSPALRAMFIKINSDIVEGNAVAKDPEKHR